MADTSTGSLRKSESDARHEKERHEKRGRAIAAMILMLEPGDEDSKPKKTKVDKVEIDKFLAMTSKDKSDPRGRLFRTLSTFLKDKELNDYYDLRDKVEGSPDVSGITELETRKYGMLKDLAQAREAQYIMVNKKSPGYTIKEAIERVPDSAVAIQTRGPEPPSDVGRAATAASIARGNRMQGRELIQNESGAWVWSPAPTLVQNESGEWVWAPAHTTPNPSLEEQVHQRSLERFHGSFSGDNPPKKPPGIGKAVRRAAKFVPYVAGAATALEAGAAVKDVATGKKTPAGATADYFSDSAPLADMQMKQSEIMTKGMQDTGKAIRNKIPKTKTIARQALWGLGLRL